MIERRDRPLVWLHGEVKTPLFSRTGRIEAGVLLRRLQRGERLGLPHSRPMPQHTPQGVIGESRRRLSRYDAATGEGDRR